MYNKHTGKIVGFTSLGDLNDDLLKLEQDGEQPQVANQLLTFLVRGILFNLNFPCAHFASCGATGDILFPLVWEAICRLETSDIKVLCITADGASTNRKFFRMHRDLKDPTSMYKTHNLFALNGRSIYFVADPPHLIKTIRNCWSHSGVNGTRLMQVCNYFWYIGCILALLRLIVEQIDGKYITWKQLWDLYDKLRELQAGSCGLSLVPELKREHLQLTSYSRMRVDLAAQVTCCNKLCTVLIIYFFLLRF